MRGIREDRILMWRMMGRSGDEFDAERKLGWSLDEAMERNSIGVLKILHARRDVPGKIDARSMILETRTNRHLELRQLQGQPPIRGHDRTEGWGGDRAGSGGGDAGVFREEHWNRTDGVHADRRMYRLAFAVCGSGFGQRGGWRNSDGQRDLQ